MYYQAPIAEMAPRVDLVSGRDTSEGRLFPLEELYFCDDCNRVIDCFELLTEVESLFCPQCLESLPPTEAASYLNRCPKCLDCPRCFHVLSIVSREVEAEEPEGGPPSAEDRGGGGGGEEGGEEGGEGGGGGEGSEAGANLETVFYFLCQFCRWTSPHLDLEASRPEGLAEEMYFRENNTEAAVACSQLIEAHRAHAIRAGPAYSDSSSPLVPPAFREKILSNEKWTMEDLQNLLRAKEDRLKNYDVHAQSLLPQPVAALSVAEFLAPSAGNLETVAYLNKVLREVESQNMASLWQRLRMVHHPVQTVSDCHPRRKVLVARKTHRCRVCNRACLPRFIIRRVGTSESPDEADIPEFSPLRSNEEGWVEFEVRNPDAKKIEITFKPYCRPVGGTTLNVQIQTPEFKTEIEGFSEIAEEWVTDTGMTADDKGTSAIIDRKNNRVMARLQLRCQEVATSQCAVCAFSADVKKSDHTGSEVTTEIEMVATLGTLQGHAQSVLFRNEG
eukprot:GHVU01167637.1.p1 GENE.GHVU01167637.1~~GHVU01167637.1.p1  ORF type:complete len:503 (-),score=110.47 GHVU01167637.1:1026-2534(-)